MSHGPEIGRAYTSVAELGALTLARRAEVLSVFSGDDRVHLDLEGRLHRAWLGGDSFQRGIDGRVRRVHIDRGDGAPRWLDIDVLAPREAEPILERAIDKVRQAHELSAGHPLPPDIAEPLERAAAWDLARYREELVRFSRAYRPIPILPPDQNRALVVQITEGCSFNRCTFCHLYKDVRFRLRPPDELRRHLGEVRELFGRALLLRRGVFLGQANALVVEQEKLTAAIRLVREELGEGPLGSFIDSFTRRKTAEELRELTALGLSSVALGLESGSAEVLSGLGKPMEVDDAVKLVQSVGEAGIRRGVIVLVGAGGKRLAREHVERTVAALEAMQLGPRDRVYLSPLHVIPGSAYEARLRDDALEPLSPAELTAQAKELRERLRGKGVAPPIALYDIRRFIY